MAGPGRLTVLGSGTAVPRAGRATSCYLLEDGAGSAFLIDLGPGALQRAAAAGHDLDRLSGVLITHIHPDHCADLVALQFALKNGLPRAGAPALPVWGHPSVALLVSRLRNAWPRWLCLPPGRMDLRAQRPGPVDLCGASTCQAFAIQHSESSLGYRFRLPNGFTLAFSGDATEGGDLLALGRDVDLLVLEAAAPDHQPIPGHLTPRRAGRVASACRARHLLLTHFYPPTLGSPIASQAREGFEASLTLAQDGMVLDLHPGRVEARPPAALGNDP